MTKTPETNDNKIFKPGMGVDITFNIDSPNPVFRSSILFECDYKSNNLIVAQPAPFINKNFKYDTLHVTTLLSEDSVEIKRFGYKCKILESIAKYELANNNMASVLKLAFNPEKLELNIRNAYRLIPNLKYEVLGKILYNGKEYYSGTHFKIYNISISGIGITIPNKTINKKGSKIINPLKEIETEKTAKIGLLLKRGKAKESILTIDGIIRVVRVNNYPNKRSCFAGVTFEKLDTTHEEVLNKFIYDAQMHEIRAMNKLYKDS